MTHTGDDPKPALTITPMRGRVAAGLESTLDVLIRVVPPPAPRARQRRLLNLGIVLDRSGSMGGAKIRHAREAVAFAIRHMDAEDLVSLTIFDDQIETPLPAAPAADALQGLKGLLAGIRPRGSTALHEGWVRGGMEVSKHQDPSRVNRVLLISDGLANVGETNPDVLVTRAGELFSRSVSTSTIGVGEDFNENLMIRMAVSGGGAGWFVESPEDFVRIFTSELSGLSNLFGQNGRLRLEPGAGVVIEDVLNDLPRTEQGWDLGPLVSAQPLAIVVRLRVRGGEPGQPVRLFTASLSCDVPDRGPLTISSGAEVISDLPDVVEGIPLDGEVTSQVTLLMGARARREAVLRMEQGDMEGARAKLADAWSVARNLFSSRGDAEAGLDADELGELMAMAADPAQEQMLKKRAMYQQYYRSHRSRRDTK